MSKTQQYQCDRCGARSEDAKRWTHLEPDDRIAGLVCIDLCDVCTAAFEVWMSMVGSTKKRGT